MRRRNQNIWKRQIYSGLLIAAVGMGSLPTVTVQADEAGDTAMGRYTESEIMLPEDAQVQDIVRMADGRLRIVGMSMDTSEAGSWKLWDSTDGGKTWEEAAKLPEEYNDGEFFFISTARYSKAGGMLICCKADIRNPLRYLLMNAVASRSVSGSFQLPLTEASPLTRRLVLRALKAGECLSAFIYTLAWFSLKKL